MTFNGLKIQNGMRARPGTLKQRKNTHRYIKSVPCNCGNDKYKFIKIMNKFECSRCKKIQGE